MSEMIERVARALCRRDIQIKRRWDTPADELAEMLPKAINMNWPQYVDEARAAIEAMREPNYVMIDALAGSIGSYPEAYLAYQAMIDAALSVSDGSREAGETEGGEDR